MLKNLHAYRKAKTHCVKGVTKVIIPTGDRTDFDFLYPVKSLFCVANSIIGTNAGHHNHRSGGSLMTVKVFNFGRETLTHVQQNGMRSKLPMLDVNRLMFNTLANSDPRPAMATPEDIVGVIKLAGSAKLDVQNNVVVAQYFRIVAKSKEELRTISRSMHFDEDTVARLERTNLYFTHTTEGETLCMDVVTLTSIDSSLFGLHENIMEVFTNTMMSTLDITNAPAHLLDNTGVPVPYPNAKSALEYERANVSRSIFIYHKYETLDRYVQDMGVVIELSQIRDLSKPEGLYKEWYTVDHTGKTVMNKTFLPRNECSPANGFFSLKMEAAYWTPKFEIDKRHDTMNKFIQQLGATLEKLIGEALRNFKDNLQRSRERIEKAALERKTVEQAQIARLNAEVEKARLNTEKLMREKEDLERELKDTKSVKRDWADWIKVITALIGLGAVLLSHFKSKKKAAAPSMYSINKGLC